MDNIPESELPDTVDTVESGACNTKKKAPTRVRGYILTWNNYKDADIEYVKTYCKENCDDYSWQEEKGKEGTPHLQIAIHFKNAKSFDIIKKDFAQCHIEAAQNWMKVKKYCMKAESRVKEGDKKEKIVIKDPLKDKELRPFQKKVIDIINGDIDDRKIYWIYDLKGCSGKTALAKHICLTKPGETLYLSGKANDIKYGVSQFVEDKELKVCIFDFPRSLEAYVSYQGVEEVKNGIFYCGKYEAKMVMFNTPHIICFANFRPELNKLSEDRWEIIRVEDGSIISNEENQFDDLSSEFA